MTRAHHRMMLVVILAACQARGPQADRAHADSSTPAVRDSSPAVSDSATGPADSNADSNADSGATAALAVLRGYYAAINARDYPRAYAAWGNDGPPGRPTPAEFAKGYANTDSVELTLGAPGRVEGAAGSRYLSVPVTIRAFERGNRLTTFEGRYTLRRSVVPGAGDASRRWHLYQATLHARPNP